MSERIQAQRMAYGDAGGPVRASHCQGCGVVEAVDKPRFKLCSRCMSVSYCSAACAAEHWHEAHQPVCDELRRQRERAQAELPAGAPLPSRTVISPLRAFVDDYPDHYLSCQVLAFALQHMARPPWGGGAGPIHIQVLDVGRLRRGAETLVVTLFPLSTLQEGLRRDREGDASTGAFLRDLVSMLGRVEPDVASCAQSQTMTPPSCGRTIACATHFRWRSCRRMLQLLCGSGSLASLEVCPPSRQRSIRPSLPTPC